MFIVEVTRCLNITFYLSFFTVITLEVHTLLYNKKVLYKHEQFLDLLFSFLLTRFFSSFRAKRANICLIIVEPLDHTCLSFSPSLSHSSRHNKWKHLFYQRDITIFFALFFYYRSEYKTNITLSKRAFGVRENSSTVVDFAV